MRDKEVSFIKVFSRRLFYKDNPSGGFNNCKHIHIEYWCT
jgi:hypothetical protein